MFAWCGVSFHLMRNTANLQLIAAHFGSFTLDALLLGLTEVLTEDEDQASLEHLDVATKIVGSACFFQKTKKTSAKCSEFLIVQALMLRTFSTIFPNCSLLSFIDIECGAVCNVTRLCHACKPRNFRKPCTRSRSKEFPRSNTLPLLSQLTCAKWHALMHSLLKESVWNTTQAFLPFEQNNAAGFATQKRKSCTNFLLS